jgi:hypothetical protein
MGHYAKVLNGRVINVIKAQADFFDTFIDSSPGEWIKTSYNTRGGVHYAPDSETPDDGEAIRYNFATIDGHYDPAADAFYAAKPFDSWVLNTDTYTWEPPVPMPDDDNYYTWDEENEQWTIVD